MKFERLPLAEARGHVLGHNVTNEEGRRVLRKGKPLGDPELDLLAALGRSTVWVARLEPGDVEENEAARRIATTVGGAGVRASRALTGRVNFFADFRGVLRVDVERLEQLNYLEGVALAVLPKQAPVVDGKMVATLKVIPYALPEGVVRAAEEVVGEAGVVHLTELVARRVALVLSGSPAARERIERGFRAALTPRLEALGAGLERVELVSLDDDLGEERLAAAIDRLAETGIELLILAGETAIMDRHDIAPRAIERSGGEVACFGAPVDPGNLLLIGYRGEMSILGAPGCARSPKGNIVDLVLPRLLVGDHLTAADIAALGHGGLLDDVPERPQPRSWLS